MRLRDVRQEQFIAANVVGLCAGAQSKRLAHFLHLLHFCQCGHVPPRKCQAHAMAAPHTLARLAAEWAQKKQVLSHLPFEVDTAKLGQCGLANQIVKRGQSSL